MILFLWYVSCFIRFTQVVPCYSFVNRDWVQIVTSENIPVQAYRNNFVDSGWRTASQLFQSAIKWIGSQSTKTKTALGSQQVQLFPSKSDVTDRQTRRKTTQKAKSCTSNSSVGKLALTLMEAHTKSYGIDQGKRFPTDPSTHAERLQ